MQINIFSCIQVCQPKFFERKLQSNIGLMISDAHRHCPHLSIAYLVQNIYIVMCNKVILEIEKKLNCS